MGVGPIDGCLEEFIEAVTEALAVYQADPNAANLAIFLAAVATAATTLADCVI